MIPTAPTGPARLFFVVGLLVFFAGFAIFAYAIVSTLATFFRDFDTFGPGNEPDFSRVGELIPMAFSLIIPGIIVAVLAAAIGPHPVSGANLHVGDRFEGVTNLVSGAGRVYQGDIRYKTTDIQIAVGELHAIRNTVSNLPIRPKAKETIQHYLRDAEEELDKDRPNLSRVEERLGRATELMERVGAFVGAGQKLIPRLKHVASLLGLAGLGGLL